jgi:hypothetical protein
VLDNSITALALSRLSTICSSSIDVNSHTLFMLNSMVIVSVSRHIPPCFKGFTVAYKLFDISSLMSK